jgi:4-amino-4-deoxy-L-arabinose transferase-like glycosyltransferase
MFNLRGLALVVGLFFVSSLAVLPLLSRYRPDEQFYTNASLQMMQTGDYVTPQYEKGTPRFNKPILNYWVIVASCRVLGVSVLSSRLPFLLSASGMLVCCYFLAFTLCGRRDTALLAVIVLATNIQTLNTSIRSTPDALLGGCLALAMLGLTRVLQGDRGQGPAACFWLGIGLAGASKGALAGVLTGFGVVAAVVWDVWGQRWGLLPHAAASAPMSARRPLPRLRVLLNPLWMAVAAAVAGFWFVLLYRQHGLSAIEGFLDDQVGERLDASRWFIFQNAATYLMTPLVELLPWTGLAALGAWWQRAALVKLWRERRGALVLAVSWWLVLLLIFVWADIRRTRYFLPAYPLLAVLLADWLVRLADTPVGARLAPHVRWPLLILAGFGVLQAAWGSFWDGRLAVGGLGLLAIGAACWRLGRQPGLTGRLVLLGLALFLAYRTNDAFARRALFEPITPAVAQRLTTTDAPKVDRLALVNLDRIYGAQLRVLLGGQVEVVRLRDREEEAVGAEALTGFDAILLAADHRPGLVPPNYTVEPVGYAHEEWKARQLLELVTASDPSSVFRAHARPYSLARRNPVP